MLLALATAFASVPDGAPPSPPPAEAAPAAAVLAAVRPFVWVRPGWTWIADAPENPTAQDGFTAEARLGVDAAVPTLPVSAKVEVALLPEPTLTDASVTVAPLPWLDLRFGQVKVPLSVSRMASDTRRLLPRGPTFLAEADVTREIGADVTVRVPLAGRDRLALASGVYNGEGPNRLQNVNQRYQLVERVLVTPFGARRSVFEGTDRALYVGIGGGWMYDFSGDGEGASETNTYAAEIQAAYDVLSIQAEILDQDIVHANASVADYRVRGFYVQLASFVPAPWARDHVELVGRLELAEPNTAFGAAEGEAQADLQSTRRVTGGLNVYVRKDPARFHDLKVQAAYEHVDPLEGADLDDDTFTLLLLARI
ncbi:MAG: hypothetical protein ACK4YP_00485 [Myxococcota bacterium]